MRKMLLLVMVIVTLIGCQQSNEEKAKSLIKQYIKENANNPGSYEAVEFGSLDSSFNSDNVYEQLLRDSIIFSMNKHNHLLYGFVNQRDFEKKIDSINTSLVFIRSKRFDDFNSFKMAHKFRINNSFGAKVLDSQIFVISKEIDKISSVED